MLLNHLLPYFVLEQEIRRRRSLRRVGILNASLARCVSIAIDCRGAFTFPTRRLVLFLASQCVLLLLLQELIILLREMLDDLLGQL